MRIYLILAILIIGCQNQEHTDTPQFTDNELLDLVQKQSFNYFWEGAEINSGMARERIHIDEPEVDKYVVTTGGSGFGLMAILVGIERGFVSREEALNRYQQIINFLENADRFHGAWPHWLDGRTGKVIPFSPKDDGADLVETAFLVQGLLTVAEYFKEGSAIERELVQRIDELWRTVEWNWFTNNGQKVLYWHWSPNYQWQMNFQVTGYNEALIMYILAAASPTFAIDKDVYNQGWNRNGGIKTDQQYYNLPLLLDHHDDLVGPLFWAHYSYLGLNPNGLQDQWADYGQVTKNHAQMIYRYCVDNPKSYKGYGPGNWGLTASYSIQFYAAHRPAEDLGVISPTAALSSFPYTPEQSMSFLRHLYKDKDSLIGKYGPYDAYSDHHQWFVKRYLAIDQGPIPVMIENYRSQLLWSLFMKNQDIQLGLNKLDFTFNN